MSEIKYTQDHEWIEVHGDGTATIGITDFAQEQLGDLVYIEIPEVGTEIFKGEDVSVIESVKAASDLVAPVSGTIIDVNSLLEDEPEKVNDDAMGAGWFIKVEMSDVSELDDLMDEAAYQACLD
ncbi:MAG: glycine cleavage system protein H [Piscirickettsiaceae bacterium CG_4_9_14_3_um_filter_43_564]|nr:glycine cleavage system protein GcvH [Thiomicrospira sp.]OIP95005.1 MAG: glycine cleavage system protein H [Thiomicrospira sp. CG2_30_44_34]PIQ04931.1 MAG: glycine cleavage system protein H [Piscirickettsiaceae bacterium CG18_big_fil_WC_8_21_14_2_50_44_103]PIU38207.1 MAG: glycine cleavage system protein H [Piscirickettsiaceae bacterium CG07_land_8_20_14_0_80_44_28]PIW57342.1 MAG: glycine cleavage system protein H [Piscirickettsiaceae bacterium CG12_big_fil_rev_8_21_14_0_65_44_934]PIW76903.1